MKTFLTQFLKTAPKNSLEKIIKTYIDFKFAEQSYIESQYKEFSKLELIVPLRILGMLFLFLRYGLGSVLSVASKD